MVAGGGEWEWEWEVDGGGVDVVFLGGGLMMDV